MSNLTLFLICLPPALMVAYTRATERSRFSRQAAWIDEHRPHVDRQRDLLLAESEARYSRSRMILVVALLAWVLISVLSLLGLGSRPPWQIPLATLFIAVLPAYVITRDSKLWHRLYADGGAEVATPHSGGLTQLH